MTFDPHGRVVRRRSRRDVLAQRRRRLGRDDVGRRLGVERGLDGERDGARARDERGGDEEDAKDAHGRGRYQHRRARARSGRFGGRGLGTHERDRSHVLTP